MPIQDPIPTFNPKDFDNNPITNPYMPLAPGNTWIYGDPGDPQALDTVTVTNETKLVDGVECVVVSDIAQEGKKVVERTTDYFAQDNQGNVWYFGEDTKTFQPGGSSTEGTWRAGVVPQGGTDPAGPGIIMLADPQNHVNQTYAEENAAPVANDKATVTSLDTTAHTPLQTFHDCLRTKNTDLEGMTETKFYAAGFGFVRGVASDGTDVLKSFTPGGASLVQAMAGFGNQSAVDTGSSSQKQENAQVAGILAAHHPHHA